MEIEIKKKVSCLLACRKQFEREEMLANLENLENRYGQSFFHKKTHELYQSQRTAGFYMKPKVSFIKVYLLPK